MTRDEDKKVLNHVLRHVVSFTGAYILDGDPHTEHHFNYSGFLVEIHGQWFVMTAGHILQSLDPLIEAGRLAFTGRVLADFYGEGATHFEPIPFDYAAHKRVHAYDEDLIDFALVALNYLEVEQLRANGRMPFTFEGRPERPWEDYDGFAILGFPDEDVTSDVKEARQGPVTVEVRPGLSPVRRIHALPPDVEQIDIAQWFVGELLDKSAPSSIVGMSGGPIVGFKRNGENLDYWIVAIQSQWYKGPRIILGCPIPVVLRILEAAVRNAENRENTQGPVV
jgi:hypothetical protein